MSYKRIINILLIYVWSAAQYEVQQHKKVLE